MSARRVIVVFSRLDAAAGFVFVLLDRCLVVLADTGVEAPAGFLISPRNTRAYPDCSTARK